MSSLAALGPRNDMAPPLSPRAGFRDKGAPESGRRPDGIPCFANAALPVESATVVLKEGVLMRVSSRSLRLIPLALSMTLVAHG